LTVASPLYFLSCLLVPLFFPDISHVCLFPSSFLLWATSEKQSWVFSRTRGQLFCFFPLSPPLSPSLPPWHDFFFLAASPPPFPYFLTSLVYFSHPRRFGLVSAPPKKKVPRVRYPLRNFVSDFFLLYPLLLPKFFIFSPPSQCPRFPTTCSRSYYWGFTVFLPNPLLFPLFPACRELSFQPRFPPDRTGCRRRKPNALLGCSHP